MEPTCERDRGKGGGEINRETGKRDERLVFRCIRRERSQVASRVAGVYAERRGDKRRDNESDCTWSWVGPGEVMSSSMFLVL